MLVAEVITRRASEGSMSHKVVLLRRQLTFAHENRVIPGPARVQPDGTAEERGSSTTEITESTEGEN